MLVLGAWLQHAFGSTGVLVAAAFAALAELHAAAASLGQLLHQVVCPVHHSMGVGCDSCFQRNRQIRTGVRRRGANMEHESVWDWPLW